MNSLKLIEREVSENEHPRC